MKKVLLYSLLLVAGLVISQFLPQQESVLLPIRLLTMVGLSYIMVHVGLEFEIDKSKPRQYVWDYIVAGTAAAFPWVFCAAYFIFVMSPPELWSHGDLWRESLLEARFSSPTSAGLLFSMLAAAGLAATWVFKKARILAIFDDLDTILLMIPLKIMMVGPKWQLGVIVMVVLVLLWLAWRYLHAVRWPTSWKWVMGYALAITAVSELIYVGSKVIDGTVPIHLEVLLPAFVLGCVLRRTSHHTPASHEEGEQIAPESPQEQRVATIVSASFMILVGLSMPPILAHGKPIAADVPATQVVSPEATALASDHRVDGAVEPAKTLKYEGVPPDVLEAKNAFPGWDLIALHVLAVTAISNLGKMFPAFCYRGEATLRERIALSIGMFPRGEVGAGVLVVSISYGLGGPTLTVAVLSLALNLLLTGVFIVFVKRLIKPNKPALAAA